MIHSQNDDFRYQDQEGYREEVRICVYDYASDPPFSYYEFDCMQNKFVSKKKAHILAKIQ